MSVNPCPYLKVLVLIICLLSLSFWGFSQETNKVNSKYDYLEGKSSALDSSSNKDYDASLPDPSFSVQTGILTGLGDGLGTYSYLAPQVRFPVSNRLTLKGGLMLENKPSLNFNQEAGIHSPGTGYTSSYFMAGGSYMLDDHLTLSGAGFMEIPIGQAKGQNSSLGNGNKGFRMNVHYEANDHLHFDVGVQIRKGSPYGHQPFLNNGFRSGRMPLNPSGRFGEF